MKKSSIAVVFLVIIAPMSGCMTSQLSKSPANGSESNPSTGDGEITAEVVSEAPPNATVVAYTDSRVQANKYIKKAVRKAVNKSGRSVVTVPESKVEKMKEDRARLPGYFPKDRNSSNYPSGYYIEFNQTVVHVEFAILT